MSAFQAAARAEVAYWQRVSETSLQSRGVQSGGLPVPAGVKDLGSFSCLSACPGGSFLAGGTSSGRLLVWDLRKEAVEAVWSTVEGGSGAASGAFKPSSIVGEFSKVVR